MLALLFSKNKERTKPLSKMQNSNPSNTLCIFASYNIDEDDIRFIEANKRYCNMVVIESVNVPSLTNMRIKNIKGITVQTRPNIGYDATSWKEYVLNNIDSIRKYDYVIFANNSCRYDFLINNVIKDMRIKGATFYGLNRSNEITDHIQSFFIIVHKTVTNTQAFYDHWKNMSPIIGRSSAIHNHELTFTGHMKDAGAVVDSLTTSDVLKNSYVSEVYHIGMEKLPPFMKKKLLIQGTNRTKYTYLLKQLPHMI